MRRTLIAGAGGIAVAFGMGIAGLLDPARVIGFLDFTGRWDATAAFVLFAAVATYAVAYRWARHRRLVAPAGVSRGVDGRLLLGAALFGVGWGGSGLCPAPALTALGAGLQAPAVFALAMAVGMALVGQLDRRRGTT